MLSLFVQGIIYLLHYIEWHIAATGQSSYVRVFNPLNEESGSRLLAQWHKTCLRKGLPSYLVYRSPLW